MAIRFPGSADPRSANTDLLPGINGTQILTMSFWLLWDAFANNDALAFEYTTDALNYFQTFGFIINPNDSTTGGFLMGAGVAFGASYSSFTRPSAGVWHHYVICWDRANPNAISAAYVDGVSQSITNGNTEPTVQSSNFGDGGGNLYLYLLNRRNTTLWGAGKLAELAIYPSTTLSAAEAAALYMGVCPLDLRQDVVPYYYPLDGDNALIRRQIGDQRTGPIDNFDAIILDEHPPIALETEDWFTSWSDIFVDEGGGPTSHLGQFAFSLDSHEFLLSSAQHNSNLILSAPYHLGNTVSVSKPSNIIISAVGHFDENIAVTRTTTLPINAVANLINSLGAITRTSNTSLNTTSELRNTASMVRTSVLPLNVVSNLNSSSSVAKTSIVPLNLVSNLNIVSSVDHRSNLPLNLITHLFCSSAVSKQSSLQIQLLSNEIVLPAVARTTSFAIPLNSDLYMSSTSSSIENADFYAQILSDLAISAAVVSRGQFGLNIVSHYGTQSSVARIGSFGPGGQSNLFADVLASTLEQGNVELITLSDMFVGAATTKRAGFAFGEASNFYALGGKAATSTYTINSTSNSIISPQRGIGGIISLEASSNGYVLGRLQCSAIIQIGAQSYALMAWEVDDGNPGYRRTINFLLAISKRG